MSKSKEEILSMIRKEEFDRIFGSMKELFEPEDEHTEAMLRLFALCNEFINPPANFDIVQFKARLQVFVSTYYPKTRSGPPPKPEVDFYDVLCEVDFKLQTQNFRQIYKFRRIAAFLLHGESDPSGLDVKWLCNQILHKEGLLNDRYIPIDAGSALGCSFELVLNELFVRFKVDTNTGTKTKHLTGLRYELEQKLSKEHVVCVIRNSGGLLNRESELCKLFDELLTFMDDHIAWEYHNHRLILLFVDNKLADYQCKDSRYFFWFDQQERKRYPFNAALCPGIKIIDLAPIEEVTENDILDWLGAFMHDLEVYNKIACLVGREQDILQTGTRPYQVIAKICNDLKIKMESKWIA